MGSAGAAEHLRQDEALDREPGIDLAQCDLLIDANLVVESTVKLGRTVVGGLPKRFLDTYVIWRGQLR